MRISEWSALEESEVGDLIKEFGLKVLQLVPQYVSDLLGLLFGPKIFLINLREDNESLVNSLLFLGITTILNVLFALPVMPKESFSWMVVAAGYALVSTISDTAFIRLA